MGLLIKKKGMVDMKIKVILKENIKGVGKKMKWGNEQLFRQACGK